MPVAGERSAALTLGGANARRRPDLGIRRGKWFTEDTTSISVVKTGPSSQKEVTYFLSAAAGAGQCRKLAVTAARRSVNPRGGEGEGVGTLRGIRSYAAATPPPPPPGSLAAARLVAHCPRDSPVYTPGAQCVASAFHASCRIAAWD
ncbi:Protein of unknown function [Gryllus bimaculatus]|nr:Protein of unknown function [Gryllus bimaculatus]